MATAETASSATSVPYHEPDIVTILILATFLIALNAVNFVLDKLVYCGLLGQIFLGILWGTPGAKWLSEETERVVVNVGYLGLILLVYEGGLATSFKSLKANLGLSVGVAFTGIALPIGLSYVLQTLAGATPLQAFAAGAALCSTSLGTTFTVLGTSGLITTRMGVVLASAAMMDDVVGLVMVQVISNLGSSSTSSFSSVTVIRPVLVSLAFAVIVPLVARFIVKPLTLWTNSRRSVDKSTWGNKILVNQRFALVVHTSILLGLVTASSYAGTSNLFAAYLAGAAISWWDSEVPHPETRTKLSTHQAGSSLMQGPSAGAQASMPNVTAEREDATSGEVIFKRFYQQSLEKILRPLFFASIGFSIPITQMFRGVIVWKGIVYTLLMAFAKLVCGAWLIRLTPGTIPSLRRLLPNKSRSGPEKKTESTTNGSQSIFEKSQTEPSSSGVTAEDNASPGSVASGKERSTGEESRGNISNTSRQVISKSSAKHPHNVKNAEKPSSLYPASIVGCAMVARGEIGFLISSLAESNGIFRSQEQSADEGSATDEIFLIVTWAIMLCTIIGPICVGFMVRRMNRLEEQARSNGTARRDVLGVWG